MRALRGTALRVGWRTRGEQEGDESERTALARPGRAVCARELTDRTMPEPHCSSAPSPRRIYAHGGARRCADMESAGCSSFTLRSLAVCGLLLRAVDTIVRVLNPSRFRVLVLLLICALGSALSVCPTDCLAAQAHVATKTAPCHADGGTRDRGGVNVSCCLPAIAEQAVRVVFDVPHVVAVNFAAAELAPAVDAATNRLDVSLPAAHYPPRLFLFHQALLI
jgi:hypothetical protein